MVLLGWRLESWLRGSAVLVMLLSGCHCTCYDRPPIHIWPLSSSTGSKDVETGISSGTVGSDVTYDAETTAAVFDGSSQAFVDVRLDTARELDGQDWSISAYIYLVSTTTGTIFQYQSDDYSNGNASNSVINVFTVSVFNGNVQVTVHGFMSTIYSNIVLSLNTLYNIIIAREYDKDMIFVIIDHKKNSVNEKTVGPISEVEVKLPGWLRFGKTFVSPHLSMTPLVGRIMCVYLTLEHQTPQDPTEMCYDYNSKCNIAPIDKVQVTAASTSQLPTDPPATESTTASTIQPAQPATTSQPTSCSDTPSYQLFKITHRDVTFGLPTDVIEERHLFSAIRCAVACTRIPGCVAFVSISETRQVRCAFSNTTIGLIAFNSGSVLYEPVC